MKLSPFLKGLIMAVFGFFATTLSDVETFNAIYVAIVTGGFTVIYLGKNWLFPSISDKYGVKTRDFISGGIVALGMGLMTFAGTLLTDVDFTWPTFIKAIIGAVIGYFIKTVPQKSN